MSQSVTMAAMDLLVAQDRLVVEQVIPGANWKLESSRLSNSGRPSTTWAAKVEGARVYVGVFGGEVGYINRSAD
jgi:hypothetical protein